MENAYITDQLSFSIRSTHYETAAAQAAYSWGEETDGTISDAGGISWVEYCVILLVRPNKYPGVVYLLVWPIFGC